MLIHIVEALREIPGLPGVTVSEVRGFGRSPAAMGEVTAPRNSIDFAPKSKLELVVPDSLTELVLAVIQKQGRTGQPGDGKVFVYTVDEVVRIRTGERGEKAI